MVFTKRARQGAPRPRDGAPRRTPLPPRETNSQPDSTATRSYRQALSINRQPTNSSQPQGASEFKNESGWPYAQPFSDG